MPTLGRDVIGGGGLYIITEMGNGQTVCGKYLLCLYLFEYHNAFQTNTNIRIIRIIRECRPTITYMEQMMMTRNEFIQHHATVVTADGRA